MEVNDAYIPCGVEAQTPFWGLRAAAGIARRRSLARLISQAPRRLPYVPKSIRQCENQRVGKRGIVRGLTVLKDRLLNAIRDDVLLKQQVAPQG
jgi:hypothetical protein